MQRHLNKRFLVAIIKTKIKVLTPIYTELTYKSKQTTHLPIPNQGNLHFIQKEHITIHSIILYQLL